MTSDAGDNKGDKRVGRETGNNHFDPASEVSASNYISFDKFRELVGEAENQVRKALTALDLIGEPVPGDRKRRHYPPEWVNPVKQWIASH